MVFIQESDGKMDALRILSKRVKRQASHTLTKKQYNTQNHTYETTRTRTAYAYTIQSNKERVIDIIQQGFVFLSLFLLISGGRDRGGGNPFFQS